MTNATDPAFNFYGYTNFAVYASNALFTVGFGGCFFLTACTNVTIAGATVRSQNYAFTQGRVAAIGTNNGTLFCDWQISSGYPTNFCVGYDGNPQVWLLNAVSATNSIINLMAGDMFINTNNALYVGNNTWQLNFLGEDSFAFQTNDWLVTRSSSVSQQQSAYYFGFCTNCTLLNCTSQCGGIDTIFEWYSISDQIRGCQVEPSPVPPPGGTELPLVANVGSIQVTSDFGGPVIENFTATNVMLDDGINIGGSYQTVTAVSGYNVTLSLQTLFQYGGEVGLAGFAVGQPVRISDTNGFFAQANCTGIQNLPDDQVITLDQKLAIPIGALASNPDANSSGYKIINCQL